MNRIKKLKLNLTLSLLYELVALVCGFILPRLILIHYGSSVNGLVSSISQFLGLISVCELGVGAVVQSALYKPLADNDLVGISRIMKSGKNFFNKVGLVLFVYVVILMSIYPFGQLKEFDFLFTAILIGSMSISFFAQYFFGINNQILLNADQKAYIQLFYQIVTIVLNAVACVVLISVGASIQIVKLSTSLIFLLRPLGLWVYVRKRYSIDYSIALYEEPLKQKWNGIAQHLSSVVLNNTDIVVLTFFSTLISVSIYNVYCLVVTGVKQIVYSLTRGIQSLFGNMLANNEKELLNKTFGFVEWGIHSITTFVFCLTGILIVPFIEVYTSGVNDANYNVPVFAVLITLATASYCYRLPYSMMVLAAGHFRQTQWSAIVEMLLNIFISVVLVFYFDIIGVAIGTLIAMVFRTFYYVGYLSKNILNRPVEFFIKNILFDFLVVVGVVGSTFWICLEDKTYFGWFIMALKVGGIGLFVTLFINFALNYNYLRQLLGLLFRKLSIMKKNRIDS